jgi:TolA-binding protein
MDKDDIVDMYDVGEYHSTSPVKKPVRLNGSGILTEIDIQGTKFHAVDAIKFAKLEEHIHKLHEKVSRYERLLQELQIQLRQKDQSIREILKELDNKVSHER